MEQILSHKTTKATCLPGVAHGQQLSIIHRVLESLAPGVAGNYRDFVQLLHYYLFMDEDDSTFPLIRKAICSTIEKINGQGHSLPLKDTMMVIDGMRLVMEDEGLQSTEELGQFTQASKEEFRHFISGLPMKDTPPESAPSHQTARVYKKLIKRRE